MIIADSLFAELMLTKRGAGLPFWEFYVSCFIFFPLKNKGDENGTIDVLSVIRKTGHLSLIASFFVRHLLSLLSKSSLWLLYFWLIFLFELFVRLIVFLARNVVLVCFCTCYGRALPVCSLPLYNKDPQTG